MNSNNSQSNKNDLVFQHYLIVFLDILGQRRIFREIRELPTDENKNEMFLDKIRKTVGKPVTGADAKNAPHSSIVRHWNNHVLTLIKIT